MMATKDYRITVNGVGISQEQINSEVQYHKAESLPKAKQEAMKALVVRELLLQQAAALDLCDKAVPVKQQEDIIEQLLERELNVPDPDAETCQRYYENNRQRFYTAPLFDVSHIFFPSPPDDKKALEKSRKAAENILKKIEKKPQDFEKLAKEYSACSSASEGGRLGQISTGQTVPAFEAALLEMGRENISLGLVESEVGFHIVKIHDWVAGKELPFEAAEKWIASYIKQQSWNRALHQYIQILAGDAEIEGFELQSADSPLVQ